VRFALAAFLVGRVVVSVLAVIGWQLPHDDPEPATHWSPQPPGEWWHAAFTGFEHYDAAWYLQIASRGYEEGDPSGAFFPLYPVLVRGLGWVLGGHWLLAATLVSNVALLVALVLVQRLTARELGPELSRPVVVLLLCSPVAFFLYAPYTESLFLALSLACLLWVREGRWPAATAAAALASATRSTGLVLGAAMAAEALVRARSTGRWSELRRTLPWCAGAPVGLLAYLAFWQLKSGDWHEPTRLLTTEFGRESSLPWETLWHGLEHLRATASYGIALPFTVESLLGFLALGLGVVAVRRYPLPYGVLVVGGLLMPLLLVIPARPLTSVARYDLVVFPLFWVTAELTRKPVVRAVVLTVSTALLCVLTMLFAAWHDVL
jgi:hypothetical protein